MKYFNVETNSEEMMIFMHSNMDKVSKIYGDYVVDDESGDLVNANVLIWLEGSDKVYPDFVFLYDRDDKLISVNGEKIDYDEALKKWEVRYYNALTYYFKGFIYERESKNL